MHRTVKRLKEELGLPMAIEVCRRWGNRELNVPVRVRDTDPLVLTLGRDAAEKLVAVFGGQRLTVPAEASALLEQRNDAIYHECESLGRSQQEVAIEFGLTRQGVKHVMRVVREARAGSVVAGIRSEPTLAEFAPV